MHCNSALPTSSSCTNCSGRAGTSAGRGTGSRRKRLPSLRPALLPEGVRQLRNALYGEGVPNAQLASLSLNQFGFTQPIEVVLDTTADVLAQIKRIIDDCYNRAEQILEENRDKLELMKDALLEYETIDVEQINDIMNGRKPRPPADWTNDDEGSGSSRVQGNAGDQGTTDRPIGGPVSEH